MARMNDARVWNVSLPGRIATTAVLAVFVAYAFSGGDPAIGAGALVAGVIVVWFLAFWPAVILTRTDVVVRNPWGYRRVPLSEVAGAGGGYAGLAIRLRSGGSVTAWALQKSNAAKWSGRATRSDEAAEAIMAAARAAV